MSEKNEHRYRIGQKVIGLNSNPVVPRVKGKVYTIDSVLFCSECGKQFLNFGKRADNSFENFGICTCGAKIDTKNRVWTSSKHYAPIDNIELQIEKAIEEENYELAASLRDAK